MFLFQKQETLYFVTKFLWLCATVFKIFCLGILNYFPQLQQLETAKFKNVLFLGTNLDTLFMQYVHKQFLKVK